MIKTAQVSRASVRGEGQERACIMAQQAASTPALLQGAAKQGGPSQPKAPQQRRDHHRHTYGAIDLGTNNCRLLIARPTDAGFTVIDAFSRIVRLGEGLSRSSDLSQGAMDRAVDALSVCADKLRRRNVSLSRSVATEACRRASNGREFIERVREATGIVLDIIEPQEEARLAVLGCHKLLEPGDGPALIFDIGGGSTELVLIDQVEGTPRIRAWWSAPWGVVSLTESEGREALEGRDRLKAYERMRERARHAFARFVDMLPAEREGIRLLGTSGTVTTLASVHLALPSYDRRAVDGLHVPVEAMQQISAMIAGMDYAERTNLPCIGTERADLVVAGCAILEAIIEIWPAQNLGIADRGIREGILRSLMARDGWQL
jgi:exopolyphosphatase/guanosine-5'-triphosphate,3'-diphosphate pyrophosphatase